jgi:hypothetical protein
MRESGNRTLVSAKTRGQTAPSSSGSVGQVLVFDDLHDFPDRQLRLAAPLAFGLELQDIGQAHNAMAALGQGPGRQSAAGHQVEQERAGDAEQFGRLVRGELGLSRAAVLASAAPYRGSPVAPWIADDVAGYLGADPAPLPHPLAIDAASVR